MHACMPGTYMEKCLDSKTGKREIYSTGPCCSYTCVKEEWRTGYWRSIVYSFSRSILADLINTALGANSDSAVLQTTCIYLQKSGVRHVKLLRK